MKIAEHLPRLLVGYGKDAKDAKTYLRAPGQQNFQRIALQPRICSKLWEALRKSLKESYKMELEFFD